MKFYDSEGKELSVPEGHQVVCGKDSIKFIKIDGYSTKFVYRQPNSEITDEKNEKSCS